MGQWVKVNAAIFDDWNSVPGTQHPKVVPHAHCGDLKLLISLLLLLKCWDYRLVSYLLVKVVLGIKPMVIGILGLHSPN